ncbi:hypothetical protein ACJRO7_024483 [Eucalyptus globulus]|uniref:Acyl-ACP thioesterase-like C-terminal domain-containing protein n=1 Tax=Eucalyptus globulus TaxID=34317 RepID=A0ABD3KA92_EUCGL
MQGGLLFRQSFTIRSYKPGTDCRLSMEALMNYLQETVLNHYRIIGLLADGFGSTPEICQKGPCMVKTGKAMVKAVSMLVMTNKETRRISKFPEEIRLEIEGHTMNWVPIINDMDVNNHMNNSKYINWILEFCFKTLRNKLMVENHEFHYMNTEYRRECRRDSLLQSLSTRARDGPGYAAEDERMECDHLLLLENG